jgi:membrane associated rhomboid family serine protease
MFLHGGWMHLLSNMWFLWLFGNNVEDRLGHVVYLVFYLLGGLAALFCHWLTDPASAVPVIGASGAVAAVLGAYAITFPFARIRTLVFLLVFVTIVDLPALLVLGVWFLGQLLEARASLNLEVDGGVAFMAHVGGFVAGLILMPLLGGTRPPEDEGPRRIDADSSWPP